MTGVLYVVATPIGNLEDMTLRGLDVLKKVNLIAAEDTRTTETLLKKYEITTPLTSYHKFSESKKTVPLIEKLLNGENIALVSDAGTPLISDPGNTIVKSAIENNIRVVPVGGISALTAFLSSISREDEDFKFIGFISRIESQIENIINENRFENLVFYESPNRIKDTMEIVLKTRPECNFSIGRELTKKFEEIKTAKIKDIINYYENNPLKGEIVCMIHKEKEALIEETKLFDKVSLLKKEGFSQKDIVKILVITDNANKNKVKSFYLKEDG